jgi:hypothetical protein
LPHLWSNSELRRIEGDVDNSSSVAGTSKSTDEKPNELPIAVIRPKSARAAFSPNAAIEAQRKKLANDEKKSVSGEQKQNVETQSVPPSKKVKIIFIRGKK